MSGRGPTLLAQPNSELPNGFHRLDASPHLSIITDLPIDDELKLLPGVFDQAMTAWCSHFSVPQNDTEEWRATMYLMLDRQRFQQAGFIPADVPQFQHGWHSGDQIWVNEQASPYYRRHLMLHEGTHWFMFRKYGKYHAPWLMEGLAEWMGTHRIQGSELQMGILPRDRLEVPFWGRISIIHQQAAGGIAPGMEEIWRYGNSAHQSVDAYAWSWALVTFMKENSDTAPVFEALLKQPAMDETSMHRWLMSRLRHKLPQLRSEWAAFVSDLDYGYTSQPGMLKLSSDPQPLESTANVQVQSNRGWQASGWKVPVGQQLEISAAGEIVVATVPKPWVSHSDGVTLEYYRGQPLGKLLMAIVEPLEKEPKTTELLEVLPVGSRLTTTVRRSGEIFFRINEAYAGLDDNSGQLTIQMRVQ